VRRPPRGKGLTENGESGGQICSELKKGSLLKGHIVFRFKRFREQQPPKKSKVWEPSPLFPEDFDFFLQFPLGPRSWRCPRRVEFFQSVHFLSPFFVSPISVFFFFDHASARAVRLTVQLSIVQGTLGVGRSKPDQERIRPPPPL